MKKKRRGGWCCKVSRGKGFSFMGSGKKRAQQTEATRKEEREKTK